MFIDLLLLLAASLLVISLIRRVGLPPLLGYLFVGLVLGPNALGWVQPDQSLPLIAEMGVVFLLFMLGLEFSLPRMLALRRVVFGLGSFQVLLCSIPLALLLNLLGASPGTAALLGVGLSLSSTAIVTRELSTLGEVLTPHGQNTIGVLLFQDVVAVLLLTLIPVFSGHADTVWYWALPLTLGKTAVLFITLLAASRWLLPPLFREIGSSRSAELFLLLALLIVLLTAWLTHLMGLSMGFGAFLAGMLLGESHYRHQVEADLRPFRDVLLGLFFISVGMLIDIQVVIRQPGFVLLLVLALVVLKALIVALVVRNRFGDNATGWRTGVALAQGSEFCFALVAQARQEALVEEMFSGALLTAVFISMAIAPVLLRNASRLARSLGLVSPTPVSDIASASEGLAGHVIICGFGRVGQSIARLLSLEKIPFTALDNDPVRVQEAVAIEASVHYGDSSRTELLEAVGIAHARLLVVAVDDPSRALAIVRLARQQRADLPILVRTRDSSLNADLRAAGASAVVPELLESSLMLGSQALLLLGLSERHVQERIDTIRRERYSLLQGYYQGAQADVLDAHRNSRIMLHAIYLPDNAHAVGRSLGSLELEALGLSLETIRRDGTELIITPELLLKAHDTVLLKGPVAALEQAEARLLAGMS
ncbi:monovalent cation:proton antiporter family protein [Pseudomonas sp. WAC2]|uniref:monovalent cation:proton antiporter family protein n=1 Tax=Pseudomonas sp. WAC2 TaxID=3055057 RepID=UPI0025B12724|nr:monovalent cation:proton antiporter family protein [Pseudomonas sp. WAC2]MDN3234809.1 monovalent cation:proton antiporter-2 (CPA2) family protein [Pseudomonas sp. WAC2]